MQPDAVSPSRTRRDGAAEPRPAGLAGASTPQEASEAVIRLIAERLSPAQARVRLRCRETQVEACWSSKGGFGGAANDPWRSLLDPVMERVASGEHATTWGRAGDEELLWVCLPVKGASACMGMLAAGFQRNAAEAVAFLQPWALALGVKLESIRYRTQVEVEKSRNAGWFRTMDTQLRILERERQKLSALVNKTDAAVFVADVEGRFRWVNAAMARRYGDDEDPSRLHGAGCRILCGANGERCSDCPVGLVHEGTAVVHQERRETRGGEVRHVYVSAFPVRTPEGRVDEVLVMLQDLTDLETLRRSEARYHLLFERSTDAIVMADPQTLAIVMANRQAKSLLGLQLENGRRPDLLALHPEWARPDMEVRYRELSMRKPLENVEVEVLAGDGGLLTCNACGALFDLDGSDAILVEFRDVTQVRKLQTELARADHLITLGTMNAGIAHEFKNRLAPLRAFAQMIGMRSVDQERLKTYSPMIIQEIDRLTALVRDILDYARPQVPVLQRMDLAGLTHALANEFAREFRKSLEEHGVRCEASPGDAALPVLIDAEQYRRTFLNLFKNCLEACVSTNRPADIRVEAYRRDDEAVVRIRDTGCGMREETLTRVFDPFYSTKGPRGTGLGMCIVKSLVEANDGTIQIESREGEGTQVEVAFPIASAAHAEREEDRPREAA